MRVVLFVTLDPPSRAATEDHASADRCIRKSRLQPGSPRVPWSDVFRDGGGDAHAYPISRLADDSFNSQETNYHYILLEVLFRYVATWGRGFLECLTDDTITSIGN